jgi:hypothetical protein
MGLSLAVYAQLTIVLLTASYVMNRSIYRHPALRLFSGILAGLTSIVTFWVVLFLPKTEYFGLLPIWDGFAGRWGLTNYFRSSYNPADGAHQEIVKKLVWSSLGWKEDASGGTWTWGTKAEFTDGALPAEGMVNEALLREARAAGAISKEDAWTAKMGELASLLAPRAP